MQKKLAKISAMQATKLPAQATALQPLPPVPPTVLPMVAQDPVIHISTALVQLLSWLYTFVYFLHITLLRLQTKIKSMKSNSNYQNDVIYFRKNPMLKLHNSSFLFAKFSSLSRNSNIKPCYERTDRSLTLIFKILFFQRVSGNGQKLPWYTVSTLFQHTIH